MGSEGQEDLHLQGESMNHTEKPRGLTGKRNRDNIVVFICYRPPKWVEKNGGCVPDGD